MRSIVLFMLASCFLLAGCGVSDYINSRKIRKAQEYEEPKEVKKSTSNKCNHTDSRTNRVVNYVNLVRSNKQQCGNKIYNPAPPIVWNTKLFNTAKLHATDMAEHNLFSHTGSDNSSASMRVANAGYDWKAVAENISAGTDTPEQTINRWMKSQGHCHNIMNPIYTEIGLACVINESSEYGIYWTLVLATQAQ